MDFAKIKRLTEDTEFSSSDVKAILSALSFILSNAVRNDVDADTLSNELQQLGLPKESANAIKRAYVKNRQSLKRALGKKILALPSVQTSREQLEWSVDYVLSSSILQNVNESLVRFKFQKKKVKPASSAQPNEPIEVNMTSTQLDSFLHELKTVQTMMQELE